MISAAPGWRLLIVLDKNDPLVSYRVAPIACFTGCGNALEPVIPASFLHGQRESSFYNRSFASVAQAEVALDDGAILVPAITTCRKSGFLGAGVLITLGPDDQEIEILNRLEEVAKRRRAELQRLYEEQEAEKSRAALAKLAEEKAA